MSNKILNVLVKESKVMAKNMIRDKVSKMYMSFDINAKEILELDEFKDCVTYSPAKLQEYILKKVMVGIDE